MKTLYRYLLGQVLATLVMSIMVCAGVLLLSNALKDITIMLQNGAATMGMIGQALVLLIPFVLVFALPLGLLAAVLLVFGRISADQELTAIRANGISLVSLVSPVILLGICLSIFSAWLNMEVGPRARVAYKRLLIDQGMRDPLALLQEGRFITEFPDHIIYLGRNREGQLEDLWVYHLQDDKVDWRVQAAKGRLVVDKEKREVYFELQNFQGVTYKKDEAPESSAITNTVEAAAMEAHSLETPDLLKDLSHWQPFIGSEGTTPIIKLDELLKRATQKPGLGQMTFGELLEERKFLERAGFNPSPVQFHINRQISFSFACLGFVLVGIPLGIRAHRRETTVGIFLAVILMVVYYSFIVLAQALETQPLYMPHLIVWIPTFLFQGLGAWMLWRANRQ
ncbi:MAG: putative permease [Verrucomicrobia bacterium]|jgi:lipopolysaccharide export system permease protein|nr:putative permease [Verrucomicrobiota bacterium]